jgi:2'-5' RNA ligase
MDTRKRLREMLTEAVNGRKNEYGCVMVYLKFKNGAFEKLQDIIEPKDLYEDPDDPSFGFETKPHVTALFGLHEDIDEKELESVIDKQVKPEIKLKDVSIFPSEKYDVLKFDVDSKDMHKFNKDLKEFPFTSNFPNYHPHCTIAYLKKGTSDKYIGKIKKFIDELEIEPTKIVYSKTDGSENDYDFK